MVESPVQRTLGWVALGLLGAVLGVAAYWLLFTAFMFYDDEGYVLITLRNFSQHGALYDSVYTQYGPFPYLLYDTLHRVIGFEFTNVSGRWITWVNWIGAASACTVLVRRVTHSFVWSVFTFAGVFAYLWTMINEPVHPGGLIAFTLALVAWLGAEAWTAGREKLFLFLVGACTGMLLMTKINVGVFLGGAACAWLVLHSRSPLVARVLTWILVVGCVLAPFALMRTLFEATWVKLYALIFSCATIGVVLTGRQVAAPRFGISSWLCFGGTMLVVILVACTATVLRGTSVQGVINGILLDPLRHPGLFFFPMVWRTGAGVLALASVGVAAWVAVTKKWHDPRFRDFVAGTRLVAALTFMFSPIEIISTSQPAWGMSYGISLAWLFAVPLREQDRAAPLRAWLALLLVFQSLHAYPVAGSQMNWGTFLWVPLVGMGMHDAMPHLLARAGKLRIACQGVGAAVFLILSLVPAGKFVRLGWARFSTSEPLGLNGAESLRMSHYVTYTLRVLEQNFRAHADVLYSAPGMYSANLWTERPTPTLANATHWFSLLSEAQQQAIIARLEQEPRAALLVWPELMDRLVAAGFARPGRLRTWLRENFTPVLTLAPYEMWVRRGRTVALLATAKVSRGEEASPQVSATLTLRAPPHAIARIDVTDIQDPYRPVLTLDGDAADVEVVACSLDGEATAAPETTRLPMSLPPISRVTLRFGTGGKSIAWERALFILRGEDGAVVGYARVIP